MMEKDEKENQLIYKQLRNIIFYTRVDFKTEIGRKNKFVFLHCNTHLVHDK